MDPDNVLHLIQFRDVYDGWSVVVTTDGQYINRWADADGVAVEGFEARHAKTQEYIDIIIADEQEENTCEGS